MRNAPEILIVEDAPTKFDDIVRELRNILGHDMNVVRAQNLNDADDLVMDRRWALVVLDLSMDISAAGSIDLGSGHATLAGLDVVERIALMKLGIPTLLVTAFDTFQDPDRFDNSIMGMNDVNSIVLGLLGPDYHGCIRYGQDGWQTAFQEAITLWSKRCENPCCS